MPVRRVFIDGGVSYHHGLCAPGEAFADFDRVDIMALAEVPLERYAALWVPRESNQNVLVRARDRLAEYVAGGGTIVSFEEVNQDWLPFARWQWRRVDVSTLSMASHPLLDGLAREDVSWHGHGYYLPAPEADVLISDADGGAVLYVDERSSAGRVLAGTLDPDCHAGYGSDRTRPLLNRIIDWTLKPGA